MGYILTIILLSTPLKEIKGARVRIMISSIKSCYGELLSIDKERVVILHHSGESIAFLMDKIEGIEVIELSRVPGGTIMDDKTGARIGTAIGAIGTGWLLWGIIQGEEIADYGRLYFLALPIVVGYVLGRGTGCVGGGMTGKRKGPEPVRHLYPGKCTEDELRRLSYQARFPKGLPEYWKVREYEY